ncbi:MAG: hypothetical protein ACK4SF_06250 [Algoriphagus aquaeductus]|uniref:hypothetical protein n=1 Tax=Algoriphagus aquaeductus TaxID=475299 RepID=UPI003918C508
MRRIKQLLGMICLLFWGNTGFAQVTPDGVLVRKEKAENKFFDRSYDEENNRLRRVNDTLNLFVNEQKKITYTALNIATLAEFEGFEKEIEGFFEIFNRLNLDHQSKGYLIRYRPETKEIMISERADAKLKFIDGMLIPVQRHEVVFTYINKMLEIRFFLGEMDELLVLKDAGITDLINQQGREFAWYENYEDKIFNKDLKIRPTESPQVITYRNIERTKIIGFDYSLGVNFLGNLFPINQELSIDFWIRRYNKWTQEKKGFFISGETYTFLSRSEEGKFIENTNFFINAGMHLGTMKTPVRAYFGRYLSNNTVQGYFENNRTKFGISVVVNPLISLKSETYIGTKNDPSLWLLGVNLNIF